MSVSKEIEMDAVDIERLNALLDVLGIKSDFQKGEYHCEVCNDTMTYENVKFVFPKDDRTVGFVCKKSVCVVEFTIGTQDTPESTVSE